MTREELYTKANGLMIPQPFAAGDASHLPSFTPILNEINGSDVNFIEGFTAAFSAPSSAGGRYVTREEMNAIGHLASANWFKLMCGGIFTFDDNLATKIGGYPKGAILDYLDGLNYNRVVSLVDNNMVNFNTVGVDEINWKYCAQGFISEQPEDYELATIGSHHDEGGFTNNFIANIFPRRDGVLSFDGTYSYSKNTTTVNDYARIVVYDTNEQGEVISSSRKKIFAVGGAAGTSGDPLIVKKVVAGNAYQIFIELAYSNFVGENFNLVIV